LRVRGLHLPVAERVSAAGRPRRRANCGCCGRMGSSRRFRGATATK
jgi:hypothetical protein